MRRYKNLLFLLLLVLISCNIFAQSGTTKKNGTIAATGQEIYLLRIKGINTPYKRSVFEKKILASNRKIINFQFVELSKDAVAYKIQTRAEISNPNDIFTKNERYFDLTVLGENQTGTVINLSATWNTPIKTTKVKRWNRTPEIIRQIKKIVSPKAKSLSPGWIPSRTEIEPNNKSHEVNLLPENRFLLGRISSRSDSDVFRLNGSTKRSLLVVKWVRLGRTSLTPQLKLYDEDFNLLNTYNFSKSRRILRIKYRFDGVPTGKVFIKVGDKLGFIRGETGGYKSYSYLLLFRWIKG
jgi:hypothetical protein